MQCNVNCNFPVSAMRPVTWAHLPRDTSQAQPVAISLATDEKHASKRGSVNQFAFWRGGCLPSDPSYDCALPTGCLEPGARVGGITKRSGTGRIMDEAIRTKLGDPASMEPQLTAALSFRSIFARCWYHAIFLRQFEAVGLEGLSAIRLRNQNHEHIQSVPHEMAGDQRRQARTSFGRQAARDLFPAQQDVI